MTGMTMGLNSMPKIHGVGMPIEVQKQLCDGHHMEGFLFSCPSCGPQVVGYADVDVHIVVEKQIMTMTDELLKYLEFKCDGCNKTIKMPLIQVSIAS